MINPYTLLQLESERIVEVIRSNKISGVYFLFDKDHKLLYIGKAKNIFNRIKQHVGIYDSGIPPNVPSCLVKFISFIETRYEQLNKIEKEYIQFYNPPYNFLYNKHPKPKYITCRFCNNWHQKNTNCICEDKMRKELERFVNF